MRTCVPQAALLAASRDREAAQAALAEAKTRQDETTEVAATSLGIAVFLLKPRDSRVFPQCFDDAPLVNHGHWTGFAAGVELVHERASPAAERKERVALQQLVGGRYWPQHCPGRSSRCPLAHGSALLHAGVAIFCS